MMIGPLENLDRGMRDREFPTTGKIIAFDRMTARRQRCRMNLLRLDLLRDEPIMQDSQTRRKRPPTLNEGLKADTAREKAARALTIRFRTEMPIGDDTEPMVFRCGQEPLSVHHAKGKFHRSVESGCARGQRRSAVPEKIPANALAEWGWQVSKLYVKLRWHRTAVSDASYEERA